MAPHFQDPIAATRFVSDGEVPLTEKETKRAHTVKEIFADEDSFRNVDLNWDFSYTPRKMRVITIGAGFSGLLIAYKFRHQYPDLRDIVDHTIYEARNDLGGTWSV